MKTTSGPASATVRWIMLVATLAFAACGNDDSTPKSAKSATGEPIVLGMAVQENSPLGSMAEMRIGAQAAARYVNEELGGIHGRPIKLVTCATSATPESNIACAHQLVDQKPIAILGGGDFLGAAAIGVYDQAGMPIIGGAAFAPAELSYARAVRFQGFAVAALPAAAAYAIDTLKAKTVAVVYSDSPASRNDVPRYVKAPLLRKGLRDADISVGSASPGTVDWTPIVAAATAKHPDVIIALTQANTCIPILQARKAVAAASKLITLDNCLDPRLLAQEGDAADGLIAVGLFVSPTTTSDPQVKTFLAKLGAYGPGQPPINTLTQEGFSEVMNVWDVLHQAPVAALTTAGILGPFKAGKAHQDFMGYPYTCDGTAVPAFPAICDAHARVYSVDHGKIVDDPTWISGSDLIG